MYLRLIVGILFVIFLAGCATPYPMGQIYTNVTLPLDAENAQGSAKMGEAECTSILGLVATGDCSIEMAMKNGGIKEIDHVDWYANSILGIIGKYKVMVYGQ